MSRKFSLFWYFLLCLVLINCSMAWTSNLHEHVHVTWGNGRCESMNDGKLLKVSLDQKSGSGFESRNEYLFAKVDLQIKLVSGNSAGTVIAYYLSSRSDHHDEIDFQFLGNVSGDPYTVHTNVFCDGQGNREQQFRLPFDPTVDFHTYSIYWTSHHIVFLVNGIPIREFKNFEHFGVPYPKDRAMKVYASLWNADDWATRGGLVKTDWSEGPFNAYFRNYTAHDACIWSRGSSSCKTNSLFSSFHNQPWLWYNLDHRAKKDMKEFQRKYMVYDYCDDTNRFPQGLPKECYLQNLNS